MRGLSLTERLKIRALSVERSRRRVITRTLASPFLRWRYGSSAPEQILIVPQDLRSADPSFWHELQHGHFGLACEIADLKGASPFHVRPATSAWERELHGFSWLRHLSATDEAEAFDAARQLVLDWIAAQRGSTGVAFQPDIMARRLMSWIGQANMLLEGADASQYSRILGSLGQQVVMLNATWRTAPDGVPRLTSLIGLLVADLAVAGHDRSLKDVQIEFLLELNRQVLPDGGHISRNPSVLADIVLDLLPLGQCFAARGREAPDEIADCVRRSLAFLRFMRMGDGMLARFNGAGAGSPAALATVLGYCGDEHKPVEEADASGYVRLERGDTTVVADVGRPPPVEIATEAQAGCLSFELSAGSRLIFVNGGYPGPSDRDWDGVARSTANHNTLSLAETSSSLLIQHGKLERMAGGLPIRGPDLVEYRVGEENGAAVVESSHDGYLRRHRLIHHRRLVLSADGQRLDGVDRLAASSGRLRLAADLPYAIHFHVHPDVKIVRDRRDGPVALILTNGLRLQFIAEGGETLIEESLFFADNGGPRAGLQIIVRGATFGETEVTWSLTRAPDAGGT